MTFPNISLKWLRLIISVGVVLLGAMWLLVFIDALLGFLGVPDVWGEGILQAFTGIILFLLVLVVHSTFLNHPRVPLWWCCVAMVVLTLFSASAGKGYIPNTPYALFMLGLAGYQGVLALLMALHQHLISQPR